MMIHDGDSFDDGGYLVMMMVIMKVYGEGDGLDGSGCDVVGAAWRIASSSMTISRAQSPTATSSACKKPISPLENPPATNKPWSVMATAPEGRSGIPTSRAISPDITRGRHFCFRRDIRARCSNRWRGAARDLVTVELPPFPSHQHLQTAWPLPLRGHAGGHSRDPRADASQHPRKFSLTVTRPLTAASFSLNPPPSGRHQALAVDWCPLA